MTSYRDLLAKIPSESWNHIQGETFEDEDGNLQITFHWDEDQHPELKVLSELSDEDWDDFVHTALQNSLDNYNFTDDDNELESSDRNDGSSADLDGESDS